MAVCPVHTCSQHNPASQGRYATCSGLTLTRLQSAVCCAQVEVPREQQIAPSTPGPATPPSSEAKSAAEVYLEHRGNSLSQKSPEDEGPIHASAGRRSSSAAFAPSIKHQLHRRPSTGTPTCGTPPCQIQHHSRPRSHCCKTLLSCTLVDMRELYLLHSLYSPAGPGHSMANGDAPALRAASKPLPSRFGQPPAGGCSGRGGAPPRG